jgi:hypothetical protein
MPAKSSNHPNGSANRTPDGVMGPWNAFAGEWGDVGRSMAQMNIEVATLASRRAKALLELPAQLAACRQPQDFWALQMSFWQTGLQQYASAMQRMTQCAPAVPVVTGLEETMSDPDAADLESTGGPVERDRITFPDSDPESAPQAGAEKRQRAA